MKTKMLILALTTTVLFAYSNKPVYPDYVPEFAIEKLEAEFVKKMTNTHLTNHIAENFISLFDNVSAIHAQYSDDDGYYYLVFGEKENSSKIELLKIEKEDYLNETYTYIDFSNISDKRQVQYCLRGSDNPLTCPTPCNLYTNGCLGTICGVWDGIQCQRN